MKALRIALCLLITIIIFITVHSIIIFRLAGKIQDHCSTISELALSEKWDETLNEIDKVQQIWNKRRIWAALTISTDDIEQIEISLNQSRKYAELRQKTDFFGEFIMFTMLVEHIPHQEGFHIAEIL